MYLPFDWTGVSFTILDLSRMFDLTGLNWFHGQMLLSDWLTQNGLSIKG